MDLIPTADKSHLDSVNEQQFDRICVSAGYKNESLAWIYCLSGCPHISKQTRFTFEDFNDV